MTFSVDLYSSLVGKLISPTGLVGVPCFVEMACTTSSAVSPRGAAPQTVLHVTKEGEPGRASRIRFRPVMNAQDTANHILVDFNAESQGDLLGDSGTTPGVI